MCKLQQNGKLHQRCVSLIGLIENLKLGFNDKHVEYPSHKMFITNFLKCENKTHKNSINFHRIFKTGIAVGKF
jgi:hypothetical protein